MRNAVILLGLLSFLLSACSADDGLITEVQKVVEVNFNMDTDRLSNSGTLNLSESSDIVTEEFGEYLDRIRDFEVNSLSFQIKGYEPVPGNQGAVFDTLGVSLRTLGTGAEPIEMFEMANLSVADYARPVVLFKSDSTTALNLTNAINFIRARLILDQPFLWEASGDLRAIPGGINLQLSFSLDLTAEVILE